MADFSFDNGGGGGSTPSHSSSKKIGGISKPVLYIGGGILIMAFLYIRSVTSANSQASTNANTNTDPSQVDYPTNSADVASELQNNNDILTGQVNSALGQFQAQMSSQYDTQLQQLTQQMQTLDGQVSQLNAHPNPVLVTGRVNPPKPGAKRADLYRMENSSGKVEDVTGSQVSGMQNAGFGIIAKPSPKRADLVRVRNGHSVVDISQSQVSSYAKKGYSVIQKATAKPKPAPKPVIQKKKK